MPGPSSVTVGPSPSVEPESGTTIGSATPGMRRVELGASPCVWFACGADFAQLAGRRATTANSSSRSNFPAGAGSDRFIRHRTLSFRSRVVVLPTACLVASHANAEKVPLRSRVGVDGGRCRVGACVLCPRLQYVSGSDIGTASRRSGLEVLLHVHRQRRIGRRVPSPLPTASRRSRGRSSVPDPVIPRNPIMGWRPPDSRRWTATAFVRRCARWGARRGGCPRGCGWVGAIRARRRVGGDCRSG